ncbi:hypothetical protein CR513_04208, partial [Mucuna pruriens]
MHKGKTNKHKKIRYDYLYLIHMKSQYLDVFKSIKVEVKLQLGKKIIVIKFDRNGEYYGRYYRSGEQHPRPFALFSKSSLWGEALKTAVYILNRVLGKTINKAPYELWTSKRPHHKKLDPRTVSCYFVGYVEHSWGYKFYDPTSRSFFEMGNARFLKEVDPCTYKTTPIIEDNVQTIIRDIVLKQDYNEVLPKTHIEQPQQPQEVSLRRSIRERRNAFLDYYIIFLQEHEDGVGLTKDGPINFYEAMHSSNSQNGLMC